jgi:CNT family concentrative nucleoside transporter
VFFMAWIMKSVMRISGTESLAAAGEVFLGQTESALLIKPYVPKMTRSEVLTLMVGGMATIAGGVMAAYVAMLSDGDDTQRVLIARNLLCASLMNAPAAIILAKILLPESEPVNTNLSVPKEKAGANFFDALADGTSQGLHLAINIGAMLIAFTAMVALVNYFLLTLGKMPMGSLATLNQKVELWSHGVFPNLSLQSLFGVIFAPVAWLIGVDGGQDLLLSGQLLGTKLALNEFVAYQDLGMQKHLLSPKTLFLMQFALCGFANFASIGIQLGGISTICPEKRSQLASLALRALLGGSLATLLSASLAGMFFH